MESERDLESIMEITADDAISIFEQTCLGIAMQLGKIQELGDDEESNPTDDFVGVMKRSADAVGSFKDYILSHSSSGGSTMFHYAACTMLWMDRVHLYIVSKKEDSGDRDPFPRGPASFLDHVSAYSVLTQQDWGGACEEILSGGAKETKN